MPSVPIEFQPDHIEALSPINAHMYSDDPMISEPRNRCWRTTLKFISYHQSAELNGDRDFKPGSYYDTTTSSQHPYWKDKGLPEPTKDINTLRSDLTVWGYCIVDEAISTDQVESIRTRVRTS